MASPTLDYERIKQNLNSMLDQNAPKEHLDQYIASEGTTLEELKTIGAQRAQAALTPQAPPEPPVEEGGFLSGAQDVAAQFARGAVGSVQTAKSAFGATSSDDPSVLIDSDKYLRQFLSAQAIKDEAEQARILKEAEGAGVLDQVMAGAKAFGVAPLDTTAGGAGSIVLTAGAALAGVPGRIAAGTIGGLQGLGTVKQTIYDTVKARVLESGGSAEEAEAKAQEAQSYTGENWKEILGGGGLGILAGVTGAESSLAAKGVAKSVSMEAAEKAAEGILKKIGVGAIKEAPLEMAQSAQENIAANVASQREGFNVPTFEGVIAPAVVEGLASAGVGGAAGAFEGKAAGPTTSEPSSLRAQALAEFDKAPGVAETTDADMAAIIAAQDKAEADRLAAATPTAVVPPTTTEYGTAVPTAVSTTEQPAAAPIPQTTTEFGAATPTAKEPAAPAVQSDSVKLANIYIDKLTEQNRPELVNKVRAIIATNDDTIINTGLSAVDTVYDMIKSGTLDPKFVSQGKITDSEGNEVAGGYMPSTQTIRLNNLDSTSAYFDPITTAAHEAVHHLDNLATGTDFARVSESIFSPIASKWQGGKDLLSLLPRSVKSQYGKAGLEYLENQLASIPEGEKNPYEVRAYLIGARTHDRMYGTTPKNRNFIGKVLDFGSEFVERFSNKISGVGWTSAGDTLNAISSGKLSQGLMNLGIVANPQAAPQATPQTTPKKPKAVPLEAVTPEAAPSTPAVEETAVKPPVEEATTGSIPFMMTAKIRSDLAKLGYSAQDIKNMKPEDAQKILKDGTPPAVKPPSPPVTEEEVVPPKPKVEPKTETAKSEYSSRSSLFKYDAIPKLNSSKELESIDLVLPGTDERINLFYFGSYGDQGNVIDMAASKALGPGTLFASDRYSDPRGGITRPNQMLDKLKDPTLVDIFTKFVNGEIDRNKLFYELKYTPAEETTTATPPAVKPPAPPVERPETITETFHGGYSQDGFKLFPGTPMEITFRTDKYDGYNSIVMYQNKFISGSTTESNKPGKFTSLKDFDRRDGNIFPDQFEGILQGFRNNKSIANIFKKFVEDEITKKELIQQLRDSINSDIDKKRKVDEASIAAAIDAGEYFSRASFANDTKIPNSRNGEFFGKGITNEEAMSLTRRLGTGIKPGRIYLPEGDDTRGRAHIEKQGHIPELQDIGFNGIVDALEYVTSKRENNDFNIGGGTSYVISAIKKVNGKDVKIFAAIAPDLNDTSKHSVITLYPSTGKKPSERGATQVDRGTSERMKSLTPEQRRAMIMNKEQFSRAAAQTSANVEEFKSWWKRSKAVDTNGEPKRFYTGKATTRLDKDGKPFKSFTRAGSGVMLDGRGIPIPGMRGPFYFSPDPPFANQFAMRRLSKNDFKEKKADQVADGGRMIPVFLSVQDPFDFDNPEHVARIMQDQILKDDVLKGRIQKKFIEIGSWKEIEKTAVQGAIRRSGFDGFYLMEALPEYNDNNEPTGKNIISKNLAVYNPKQIKGVFNEFAPGAAESEQFSRGTATGDQFNTDMKFRSDRKFGVYPYLRASTNVLFDHKRKIMAGVNPNNAALQIQYLNELERNYPNPLTDAETFVTMMSDAFGSAVVDGSVPLPPYNAIKMVQNPTIIEQQIGRMRPSQRQMAEDGFKLGNRVKAAYISKKMTPTHTAKFILWGMLSRGVSPFIQESAFLDVVTERGNKAGVGYFIQSALDGNFDKQEYLDWARMILPEGSPGNQTKHNLNDFGKSLVKLTQTLPSGKTLLQEIHDMIADYRLSGKEIRRRFHSINTSIGINNKVLSFILLVSGRNDVVVLDRVQMRNLFNDGRFDAYNLYDGEKIPKMVTNQKTGKTALKDVLDTGTAMNKLGDDMIGLMYYEAIERGMKDAIKTAYNNLGRGNGSPGQFHWESWVATSAQEVDHGSIEGILRDALGVVDPYYQIHTRQGKYNEFTSGMIYGYDINAAPYVELPDGLGNFFRFTPTDGKAVLDVVKKPENGIIPPNFKVSQNVTGPWYNNRQVNKAKLNQLYSERGTLVYGDNAGLGKADTDVIRPGRTPAATSAAVERAIARSGEQFSRAKKQSKIVEEARVFATEAHAKVGQLRKYTNDPYIVHPEEVMQMVRTVPHTDAMLAATLMHDVVEDTGVTSETVREKFGDEVADLVGWLTDVSKPEQGNRAVRKAIDREHTAAAPAEAQTIKLADLISNTRSIVEYDKKFAKVYLEEKRLLLDVMTKGDATLMAEAKRVLEEGQKSLTSSGEQFSRSTIVDAPSLNNLPKNINIEGYGKITAGPFKQAREAAYSYMQKAGLPYNPPTDYVKVDANRAKRVADAYEAMVDAPQDPEVKASYDQLVRETMDQWEAIKETGLKVEFFDPKKDPYKISPRLATEDVRNNNHLWVFSTDDGYGMKKITAKDIANNPLLEMTKETFSGRPTRVNDIFRVVHDYFGHIKEGNGFRADGEENAWRSHVSMFSPLARRAMTSETRGQNSWLNYGPFGEKNRTAQIQDTIFADQKVGLMPEWTVFEGAKDFLAPSDEQFSRAAAQTGENVEEFNTWGRNAIVSNDIGEPRRYYTGTSKDIIFNKFKVERHGAWFTTDPAEASMYAKENESKKTKYDIERGFFEINTADRVIPVFLRAENPYTGDIPSEVRTVSNYKKYQSDWFDGLRRQGYDAWIPESINGNLVVILKDPNQIKGAFNEFAPGAATSEQFSRATAQQKAILARIQAAPTNDGIVSKFASEVYVKDGSLGSGLGGLKVRFIQGLFDYLAPLKLIAPNAYKKFRIANNSASIALSVIANGPIERFRGGYRTIPGAKSLTAIIDGIGKKYGPEGVHLWTGYMAAKRSKRLILEGRESLMTQADIDQMLDLINQYPEFETARKEWIEFNDKNVDFARANGTLTAREAASWKANGDYIPFYRALDDDGGLVAPGVGTLARQSDVSKKLKGSDKQLGNILENMILNTDLLVRKAIRNDALRSLEREAAGTGALQKISGITPTSVLTTGKSIADEIADHLSKVMGIDRTDPAFDVIVQPIIDATDMSDAGLISLFGFRPNMDKDVMVVRGPSGIAGDTSTKRYYKIKDPLLVTALTFVPPTNLGFMRLLTAPKILFTRAITMAPPFMAANLFRDTLQARVLSNANTIPFFDTTKGLYASLRNTQGAKDLQAGGGSTTNNYDSSSLNRYKKLTGSKSNPFMVALGNAWGALEAIGNATEVANRIAIREAKLKSGASLGDANFEALDIMDFSLRGSNVIVNFIISTVPFMNARLQGMYKLGRAGYSKENRANFLLMGSMFALASLGLAAMNEDDERYQEETDVSKDNYIHIYLDKFLPKEALIAAGIDKWTKDFHIALPKPFEIGAVFMTIPERMYNVYKGTQQAKDLRDSVWGIVGTTFKMHPVEMIPYPAKIAAEQVMNVDLFRKRDIVPENKRAPGAEEAEYEYNTPEILKAFSQAVKDNTGVGISPLRAEKLIRDFAGTFGEYFIMAGDMAYREMNGMPQPINESLLDSVTGASRFLKPNSPAYSKHKQDFYNLSKDIKSIVRVLDTFDKENPERADKFREANDAYIRMEKKANSVSADLSKLRKIKEQLYREGGPNAEAEIKAINADENELTRDFMIEFREVEAEY